MEEVIEPAITVLCSIIASSGFWAFLQRRHDKHDANTQLLIGLAHDTILERGMYYLKRGDWITIDEYENLVDYLYTPYANRGGNGSAKRVIDEIKRTLRIVDAPPIEYTKNGGALA